MAGYGWRVAGDLVPGQGGIGLFPNHGLRIVGLRVMNRFGMAVAKDDNAIAVVASHEAAIADLGLAEGVHGPAAGRKGTLIGETGFGKEGGFGGLLNPVQVEDAGRGIRLLKLGVDAVGKVSAVDPGGGILGRLQEKEATLLIKGRRIRPVVAGGEKTSHGRKNIVPSVRFLTELAESLQTFASLLGKIAIVFGGVGDSQGAKLLELAGGFGFTGGGKPTLNGGDAQGGEQTDDGDDHEELDQGKRVGAKGMHGRKMN